MGQNSPNDASSGTPGQVAWKDGQKDPTRSIQHAFANCRLAAINASKNSQKLIAETMKALKADVPGLKKASNDKLLAAFWQLTASLQKAELTLNFEALKWFNYENTSDSYMQMYERASAPGGGVKLSNEDGSFSSDGGNGDAAGGGNPDGLRRQRGGTGRAPGRVDLGARPRPPGGQPARQRPAGRRRLLLEGERPGRDGARRHRRGRAERRRAAGSDWFFADPSGGVAPDLINGQGAGEIVAERDVLAP